MQTMPRSHDNSAIQTPQTYGLPHEQWRPEQKETIDALREKKGIVLLSAPTGSGKTSFAKAVSQTRNTIALVRTKSLQQENYRGIYNFDVLTGKANYPCGHPDSPPYMTTEDCTHKSSDGKPCTRRNKCSYYRQKELVFASPKISLNYALFLGSHQLRSLTENRVLFLDECHQLPDIVTEYAGIMVNSKIIREWRLPSMPSIDPMDSIIPGNRDVEKLIDWLDDCTAIMKQRVKDAADQIQNARPFPSRQKLEEYRQGKYLLNRLSSSVNAIRINPNEWFIKIEGDRIIGKPLTARFHFNYYFTSMPELTVLMSATLGNPQTLASELGIKKFEYMSVPNQWPPESRPIFALDVPSMGRGSVIKYGKSIFEKQADVIAREIQKYPSNWTGVLHVTRKTEAVLVAKRLASRGLGERVWIPPQAGTDKQMSAWRRVKAQRKGVGLLAIAWTWFEGVDLTEERICGCLKTPFPSLADPFEKRRQEYSRKMYLWRTANRLEQCLGRTRRGEPEDYDTEDKQEQFVFIADKSWSRVKSYLSDDMREAIVKL